MQDKTLLGLCEFLSLFYWGATACLAPHNESFLIKLHVLHCMDRPYAYYS